MTLVRLGNSNPQMQGLQGPIRAQHLTVSVTEIEMWDGFDDPEFVALTLSTDNDRRLANLAATLSEASKPFAIGIHEIEQILDVHAAGAQPTWVESDDLDLMKALSDYYKCPQGEPTNLLTNAGIDAASAQILTTATQPAAFNYIALTASTSTPLVTDTTLTGEITTGGGGLIRAQATYAHTVGTNTSTLTKTFTANGSDSLPVTIAAIGVFNASSSGTIIFHTLLSGTATLSVIGDNITVTETVTV